MKTMITATFTLASQNSTSPNDRTEMRFVAVKIMMRTNDMSQSGIPGNHPLRMEPPTTASKAMTPTQKYQ